MLKRSTDALARSRRQHSSNQSIHQSMDPIMKKMLAVFVLCIVIASAATPAGQRIDKILVLDDEAELRNMLQRFLGAQGFLVRVAADGKRLDRFLAREPFDLLVLDLMMEPEDGLTICRRLRAEGHTLP